MDTMTQIQRLQALPKTEETNQQIVELGLVLDFERICKDWFYVAYGKVFCNQEQMSTLKYYSYDLYSMFLETGYTDKPVKAKNTIIFKWVKMGIMARDTGSSYHYHFTLKGLEFLANLKD